MAEERYMSNRGAFVRERIDIEVVFDVESRSPVALIATFSPGDGRRYLKAAVTAAPHCGARDIMLCKSCQSFATSSEGNGSKRRPECHTGSCGKKAAAWEISYINIM